VAKIGYNFLDMAFTMFSGRTDSRMHSRTHSRTDILDFSMPPVPFFNRGRDIKTKFKLYWVFFSIK